ncbi:Beta-lactamase-like protein 2 [Cercospora beticola]|uniref:Beta-lactamase-like protein 2 n=1 Tax=Cercospora beticola TaxID=122368 RepID=A0A2G5I204_CERBT|nr:Beta-lactamase-like protein 2 [Cercospora beticola]PIA98809.1 Beta-lactamase-like protein 2 [Cercospora beticola]WPA99467.1 hypothetical protein RHO25_004084 [Cercospora beticola]CAK1362407.1 unnamed protein product [Cercospora beticola]
MGEGGYKQINKSLNICAFDDYLTIQQSILPSLADVEQLTPRVIRILGQNPGKFTLQGTNTYIVGTGSQRLIIDTGQGFREWADLILETLQQHNITLSHVLLTHWHGDHTGGVPDLIRMDPSLGKSIWKHSPEGTQRSIEEGDKIQVEGATLRAVHSPGHSHDHMCFVLEEENAMFTGDNILGHGVSSAVEELSTYMNTLHKMRSQNCGVGYPAHGAVIPNLRIKISAELARKTRREKQYLLALQQIKKERMAARQAVGVTVEELVLILHGMNIDAEVRKMALEPFVEEVLRKLAEDGKAAFQIRGGQRLWFSLDIS